MKRCGLYCRALALALATVLSGCAKPALIASWYMTPAIENGNVLDPSLIVALNNVGPKTITIYDIALSLPPKGSRQMANLPDFRADVSQKPVPLPSGKLLVVELEKRDRLTDCSIPLALYVRTEARSKPYRITLGGMPAYLTDKMMTCNAKHYRDTNPTDRVEPSTVENQTSLGAQLK